MIKKHSILLIVAACAMLFGIGMLIAQSLKPDILEMAAKILLATGCLTAVSCVMFGGKSKGLAYGTFAKQTMVNAETGITFKDVAANSAAKASLNGMVDYIRSPEKYSGFGARMPRGVLLYGPPGTGKTLLARALAGEAGVPFFALSGSDFVQMYVGVGASRVRELFANARKAGKCVIFIDEIDAIGKRRSDTASEERDQTLNALLSEMSGFNSGDGIIVVAATNRIETLDAALLRPGRFDRHIEVGLPGPDERLDILKLHSKNKPLSNDVDLENLAKSTCSFSGAALESLLNEAAILAVQRSSMQIELGDINKAFYRVVAGADGKSAMNADERCTIAVHEAGHAVVMKYLQPEMSLKRISILSASKGAAGYNLAIPAERSLVRKTDMENQIAVLLAGRAAELLVGGDEALTSGASGDLVCAAEIASGMIMDLGMCGEPAVSVRAVSTMCGSSRSVEEICRAKLDEQYHKAYGILENNVNILMRLTEKLLECETLDEKDIEKFFDGI